MNWNLSDGRPIWQQLHEQLTLRILGPAPASVVKVRGSKMPTVRELAAEAGVNPNTMQRALAQLEADGLVVTNRTAGRTVTDDESVLTATRRRLAHGTIKTYLDQMALLGFTRAEAAELLQTWEEEDT